MKNLKNLTIASTLCVSACITAPTLTNAMMKSGKTPALSTNFMSRQDYISLTGTGKKTPGPFVQSIIRMFGDKNNSDRTTPKPIPTQTPNTSDASTQTNPQASKGKVGKLKKFFGN